MSAGATERDMEFQRPPDHERRMAAMRARAEWELGDASWAGILMGAYFYPDHDTAALRSEKEE